MPGDWTILFVISRVRKIENLDILNSHKNIQTVRYNVKHGGQIILKVTGKQKNKGFGLELLGMYTFFHKMPYKRQRAI